MSVNYTSVVGVGVMEDELDYTSLTEESKNIVRSIWKEDLPPHDFYDEEGNFVLSDEDVEEILEDWFSENISEYDLWYELGLEKNTGNYFSGETGYRGVSVDLNNIESAKEDFRKIVALEPEVFNGVLVW